MAVEELKKLLDNNARWAAEVVARDPGFFQRLSRQQAPEYLWIGCSDSRVPANEITGMLPGEIFVHRNVANVVVHSDINCQSVIQFAVDYIKVKHIMVVGHYGCSGVHAALNRPRVGGISDYWIGHVRDVASLHQHLLDGEPRGHRQESLLCELNVMEQALNVCTSSVVRDAWARGQPLSVHGWIYGLGDGLLRHLDLSVRDATDLAELRSRCVSQLLAERARFAAMQKGNMSKSPPASGV
ncbi:MAG: carbonate dehydratase [Panacagrimonas sp.]